VNNTEIDVGGEKWNSLRMVPSVVVLTLALLNFWVILLEIELLVITTCVIVALLSEIVLAPFVTMFIASS
jgi:hypothetical protein